MKPQRGDRVFLHGRRNSLRVLRLLESEQGAVVELVRPATLRTLGRRPTPLQVANASRVQVELLHLEQIDATTWRQVSIQETLL